jgi:hypothetical protein
MWPSPHKKISNLKKTASDFGESCCLKLFFTLEKFIAIYSGNNFYPVNRISFENQDSDILSPYTVIPHKTPTVKKAAKLCPEKKKHKVKYTLLFLFLIIRKSVSHSQE